MALHPLYLEKVVCEKHPELKGDRYPASGECVMCSRPAVFLEGWRKERKEKAQAVRESRRRAKIEGSPYYLGKVCDKHPDLVGKRYLSTSRCIACSPRSPIPAEVRASRQAAREGGHPYYLGKVCDRHPELKGARYTSTGRCVGCASRSRESEWPHHRTQKGLTPARYHGKLCDLHPSQKGLRYKSNHACIECMREANEASKERRAARKNKAEIEAVLARQRGAKADER